MNEAEAKLSQQLNDLRSAAARLKEALATPMDEKHLVRDSSIKRFEMCAELTWKTLKQYLYVRHGVECASPLGCLRAAHKADVLADDPLWIRIFEMRNLAAHTYKEALAQELYEKLPDALARFESLIERMSAPDA